MRGPQQGFTLVELLIAIAIIGILSAVALPSYRDYVRRGTIPDALSALSDYRIKMESYYQDYRNYGEGDACASKSTAKWAEFGTPSGSKFEYTCKLTDGGQGFTVSATGLTGSPAVGHEYTLDQSNAKLTITFKGAASGKACWLVSGSEC